MMPRIMRRATPIVLVLSLSLLHAAFAAANDSSLYESLSRRSEVKVFVSQPTDVSEKKDLDAAVLKQAIENALGSRKSIHFKAVSAEAEADLAIDTESKGFMFAETDPVDMLVGVGAAAMDAATIDHYGAAEATVTVRDVKKKDTLWKDNVRASVTDHTMTELESRKKVSDKLAEMLMRQAFGKKKK